MAPPLLRLSLCVLLLGSFSVEAGAAPTRVPRTPPKPALAFSAAPLLNFLSDRQHTCRPSKTCSSLLRPRWIRAALLRTGKASGSLLLTAKVRSYLRFCTPASSFLPYHKSAMRLKSETTCPQQPSLPGCGLPKMSEADMVLGCK